MSLRTFTYKYIIIRIHIYMNGSIYVRKHFIHRNKWIYFIFILIRLILNVILPSGHEAYYYNFFVSLFCLFSVATLIQIHFNVLLTIVSVNHFKILLSQKLFSWSYILLILVKIHNWF